MQTNEDIEALWARDVWALRVHDKDTEDGYHNWAFKQRQLWLDGPFDQDRALKEGWCLIGDEDEEPLKVCKDDESPIFISDFDADEFVYKMANAGSLYHQKARYHIQRSKDQAPEDYEVCVVENVTIQYSVGEFRARSSMGAAHRGLLRYKDMDRDQLNAVSECLHSTLTLKVTKIGDWSSEDFEDAEVEDHAEEFEEDEHL